MIHNVPKVPKVGHTATMLVNECDNIAFVA